FPAPEGWTESLRPLPEAVQDRVRRGAGLVLQDERHRQRRIQDKVHGRPSFIRSLSLSFSFPGGLSTLRLAFIRAMTSWIASWLGRRAGTSLAASWPWSVMEKLSPLCTRSSSSENLAFASDAPMTCVAFILFAYVIF